LKVIAREGSDAIYNGGSLALSIVDEIQKAGGVITMEDLKSFQPKWGKPIESKLFNGDSFFTFPLPTTGHVLNFIINILNGYNIQNHTMEYHNEDKLIYHRIIEAFKFGFAKRTKLGDESSDEVLRTLRELESVEYADSIRTIIDDTKTYNDYEHYGANASVSLDYGTGHISILAANGDAVALTSTINFM
jgi:gamma-glutamyltranspeptidase/glutathione hydrolase/leukotriene-C4 hydrolase